MNEKADMKATGLFPTTVIGSLPRPTWVIDLLIKHQNGALSDEALDEALDKAITFAIGLQEAAGIDIISDGEWRRIGYFEVFAQMIDGFERAEYRTQALAPEVLPTTGLSAPQQWTLKEFKQALVVGQMSYSRPIAAAGAAFLRRHTQRQIKVALPSPHMIGGRLWHPDHSSAAYATRRDFVDAVIPILRGEVLALREAGVDVIQFDDPWLCFFVDPEHRARFADPDAAMAQAIDDLNRVLAGIDGIKRRCTFAAGIARAPFTQMGIMSRLCLICWVPMSISWRWSLPFQKRVMWRSLNNTRPTKKLAWALSMCAASIVDTPELIVERVEKALRYLKPEQITLNPDCGFAPTSTNPISLEEASQKLVALSRAAGMLRERYG